MTSLALPHAEIQARGYRTIADHGVIGDLRTVALVATDGTIDWCWTPTFDSPSVFAAILNRSALALKLLTYAPTGAIVAAPTTSLPEEVGGGHNWDYRYTWASDAALTLKPMLSLGFLDELRGFAQFLTRCLEASAANGSGPLQVLYGIDGRTRVPEEILDHLEGYEASGPVRIGNDAAHQLHLDIYGEIIDAAYLLDHHTRGMPYDLWRAIASIVEWVCENWDQPDEGIWETRGGRQRFTHSRLMCWVALDRAIRIAQNRGFRADLARWLGVRDEIFHRIMRRSWSECRHAFVQHEQTDVLDASVLLMPLVGFISPTDRAGSPPSTRSDQSSSPTALCTVTTQPHRPTASKRCSPTRTTSASTPSRSAPAASSSATFPKPSPTWR